MDKNIKLVLDLMGIVISSISLGVLVVNEYYVASALISLFCIGLLMFALKLINQKPYTLSEVANEYIINNQLGTSAEVKKYKKIRINERNLTLLEDHRISGSGVVSNFSTNIGTIIKVKDFGGSKSVYTSFDTPLEVGKEYEHIIKYHGENCFNESKESVAHPIGEESKLATIRVTFPKDRLPKVITAVKRHKSRVVDLSKNIKREENVYSLLVKNPELGAMLALSWEW